MRLFISIPLDASLTGFVSNVQSTLRQQNVRGNYTPQENLHITLAFIGEFGDPNAVLAAMEKVRFSPFTVSMDHIGCFGDLWWAGLAECSALEALARKLRRALAEANIPFDKKRFRPHVTLLRRAENMPAGFPAQKQYKRAEMTVHGISLMLSTRSRNGMIYTELGYVAAE